VCLEGGFLPIDKVERGSVSVGLLPKIVVSFLLAKFSGASLGTTQTSEFSGSDPRPRGCDRAACRIPPGILVFQRVENLVLGTFVF